MQLPEALCGKLSRIKLIAMDVDGTLTDGSMIFHNGSQIKAFHAQDGLGIRLAMNFGIDVAWITGNVSDAVADRAKRLGIECVYQGARYKTQALSEIISNKKLDPAEIAYIGDDLNDLPAFNAVGVSIAVSDAAAEVKDAADIVTSRSGGRGAVREAIEIILKARGQWQEAVASFLDELEKEEEARSGPEAVA